MDNTLLVAYVSAIAAIIAAFVSQVFMLLKEYLNQKHLKYVLLREKYEELANSIQDALVISNKASESNNIGELVKFSINEPIRKAMTLSLIYFPEFKDTIGNFQNSYITYYNVLASNYSPHLDGNVGAQAVAHNFADYERKSKLFMQARVEVDLLLEKYAYKYIKA